MSHKFDRVEEAISWAAASSAIRGANSFQRSREQWLSHSPRYNTKFSIDDVFLSITKAWRNGSLAKSDLQFMGETIKNGGKNLQTDGQYARWERCLKIVKPYFVEKGIIHDTYS